MKTLVRGLFVLAVAAAFGDVQRNVPYGEAGGQRLLLDACVPEGPGPFPIAILVHGGGWSAGDKSGSDVPGNTADISPWFGPLTAAKFTWFSINYRLAPANRWPACFDDLRTAIRWVKAHGSEFKGDTRHIALVGHSAGGHLVALAATDATADTRVQAVLGFAPVADLERDSERRGGLSPSLQGLFGLPKEITGESRAVLREFSPIEHVKAGLPPFLLIQGDQDKTVPIGQTLAFQARLRASGVRCDLIVVKGAPHSLVAWDQFDPGYKRAMIAWLRETLGVSP